MSKIKIAVIGVGSLGQHHARILSTHENAELIGVVDADAKRGESIAKKCNTASFTDVKEVMDKIQAAVISVPTPYHYDIAKQLLQAGIHCLVEKPFTETVEQSTELIRIARDKNLILQVGHVERFNPAIIAATPYVKEPKFIEVNRLGPYDPRTSHIGVVLDLMIHDLDMLLNFVKSKVVSFEAVGAKILSEHEDIAKVRIKFANGCIADVSTSRVTIDKYRKIRIFQKDSYISVDYAGKSLKIYQKKPNVSVVKSLLDIDVIKPKVQTGEPLAYELTHFLKCVIEGKKPLVSGEQGRDALELAHDIL
ncbi:MAG: Gfo/Idh/MocA family oxidoreductase, partial [Elusimicrobia bacterium]|nr:Gfo/Idh/MocA family oxidoreductase [Elusimicrobiota bacterium]